MSLVTGVVVNSGNTPLHNAAIDNKEAELKSLLSSEKVPDLDARNLSGYTALHLAVAHGKSSCALLLLDTGSACNTKNERGESLLHTAIKTSSLEIIKRIVSKEADTSVRDARGYTLLHEAAVVGHLNKISYLLKLGLSPKDQTNEGQTPYDLAKFHWQNEAATLINASIQPELLESE